MADGYIDGVALSSVSPPIFSPLESCLLMWVMRLMTVVERCCIGAKLPILLLVMHAVIFTHAELFDMPFCQGKLVQ